MWNTMYNILQYVYTFIHDTHQQVLPSFRLWLFLQAFSAVFKRWTKHFAESSTGSNDHAFLRAPNGAHLGPVSQAARQPRSGSAESHAEWFSAQVESQRFAEARELVATWQPQQIQGGTSAKQTDEFGKALRFYTHTNLTHPEIDSWQSFFAWMFFWTYVFLLMGLSLRCSFKNRLSY